MKKANILISILGSEARILYDRKFQILLLANIPAPLGTALLSPLLNSLIDPFGTSAGDIGLLISFLTAPAIVMTPLAGILADRFGRKPILVTALLLFGIAGSAIGFTSNFRVALGLRLLQGVGFGGLTPIIITSLGDTYDANEEATAQGIRFAGSGLSQTLFPALAGTLVVIGWQYPFFLYSISIPIAIAVYIWFSEPESADGVNTAESDDGRVCSQLLNLSKLVKQQHVISMVIARGLPMFVWMGFLTYNSIVVVQIIGGTPTQAGFLVAVASLTFGVAGSQAGRMTAVSSSRFYPLIGANICLGVGFILFLFASSILIAGIGIMIVSIGFGLTLTMYRSIITGLASASVRGSLVSLAEAFGRVVATLAPVLLGGTITIITPYFGIKLAVRMAGFGAAVVGSVGGVICLLLTNSLHVNIQQDRG